MSSIATALLGLRIDIPSDTIVIPEKPIVHLAVALLARERGETGGTTAQDYFALADTALSDAIAHDAYKNPEEYIYRPV